MKKKPIAMGVALLLSFAQVLTVSADQTAIEKAQQEKAQTEALQSELSQSINDLEEQKNQITGQIDDTDAQLVMTIASISSLTQQIEDKQAQIDQTTAELAVAEEDKATQYAAMKKRIQYLYEKGGNAGWATILLEENNITDFLNQAEYTQKMYEYDRNCLQEYAETVTQVSDLQTQLSSEKAELEASKRGSEEEEAYLQELLAQMRATSDDFDAQLASATEKAAQYQELLTAQNEKIQQLVAEEAAAQKAAQEAAEAQAAAEAAAQQAAADAAAQAAAQQAAQQAAAAAAAAAQQQAAANQTNNGGTTNNSGSNTNSGSNNSSSTTTSGTGSSIANYALQFVGNPYVWGGNSLTNGTDCSGFIHLVYAHFGYSVSRSSASLRSDGYAVSYAEMQPGDIICYDGHVAMYIGGGQMVHAANESVGIVVSSYITYRPILTIRRIV